MTIEKFMGLPLAEREALSNDELRKLLAPVLMQCRQVEAKKGTAISTAQAEEQQRVIAAAKQALLNLGLELPAKSKPAESNGIRIVPQTARR